MMAFAVLLAKFSLPTSPPTLHALSYSYETNQTYQFLQGEELGRAKLN